MPLLMNPRVSVYLMASISGPAWYLCFMVYSMKISPNVSAGGNRVANTVTQIASENKPHCWRLPASR